MAATLSARVLEERHKSEPARLKSRGEASLEAPLVVSLGISLGGALKARGEAEHGGGPAGSFAAVTLFEGDFLSTERLRPQRVGLHGKGGLDRDPFEWEDAAWTDGDLVFANSTCFSKELMSKLSARASELKPGSMVVTLTQALEGNPSLEIALVKQLPMSWGAATAYFHRRK